MRRVNSLARRYHSLHCREQGYFDAKKRNRQRPFMSSEEMPFRVEDVTEFPCRDLRRRRRTGMVDAISPLPF